VEEYLYRCDGGLPNRYFLSIKRSQCALPFKSNSIRLPLWVPARTRSAPPGGGCLPVRFGARFGINLHLEYYDAETLTGIVLRSADILQDHMRQRWRRKKLLREVEARLRVANALFTPCARFCPSQRSGRIDKDLPCMRWKH